jgi:transcriptional regulator with XRE-family HTH domain
MSHRHQTLTRFGLNVRRRREAAGLSQEALAEKASTALTSAAGAVTHLALTRQCLIA